MDEVAQPAAAPERAGPVSAGPVSAGPESAGDVLRRAREARGLSLARIAEQTRVPQRHLEAIEAGDYQSLPSHTYATGFARAYARAVGADEVAIAAQVRREVDRGGRRQPEYRPYEAPDPARVPSRGLAVVAAGLALAVAVLAGLWFLTDVFRGGGAPAGGNAAPTVVAVPPVAPVPAASPTPATGGQVVLAARGEVWMRVYDAADRTLYLGTLAPGARFEVPANADRPQINVGRPDQLAITVNGSAVAPLGDGRRAIKDVAIDAQSLIARGQGAPEAEAAPTTAAAAPRRAARPRPRPRRVLTETQRANLNSAANPPPAAD